MTKLLLIASLLLLAGIANANELGNDDKSAALNFKMKSIDGKDVDLNDYKGKVVLVVNVASRCGLTPQYKQLQALHDKYADKARHPRLPLQPIPRTGTGQRR